MATNRRQRALAPALWPVLALALVPALAAAPLHAAPLPACAAHDGAELEPACREAIEAAGWRDVLELVEPWIRARNYTRALAALDAALARNPRDADLLQRRHEVQSMAEEAAWLASRERGGDGADIELALAETRCTRLAGEAALRSCEQALRRKPGDAALLAATGDHLTALGRRDEALAAYRAALARAPSAALEQRIALLEGSNPPRPAALDEQLASLQAAREKGLITPAEYDGRRAALLAAPAAVPGAQAGVRADAVPAVDFGRYHALVIGIDAYRHLPRLATAVNDATAIARVLQSRYGFAVRLMADATRAEIVETLDEYRAKLEPQDNLLIYYAGHGWLDPEADKGFWLPVDAREDRRTNWVSNDTVRDALRALKAKHVLVVADSCFAGTLTRDAPVKADRGRDYIQRMATRKARQALTSGGLEPVADSGGSGHSPFAAALLDALGRNEGVLEGTALFAELRRPVAVSSEQVPQFADIRQVGHQGGDFMFVRRP